MFVLCAINSRIDRFSRRISAHRTFRADFPACRRTVGGAARDRYAAAAAIVIRAGTRRLPWAPSCPICDDDHRTAAHITIRASAGRVPRALSCPIYDNHPAAA
jgi:hypothetical protein